MTTTLRERFHDASRRRQLKADDAALSIHIATIEDAPFMYQFSGAASEADKVIWAWESLNDPAQLHLIGAIAGKPAALLALRDDEDGSLAISISVTKSHDQTIGTQLLKQASDIMRGLTLSAKAWRQKATSLAVGDQRGLKKRLITQMPA